MNSYKKLLTRYKENTILGNINGTLSWDFEVIMPKKGTQQRAEQLAMLSGIIHKRSTDPKIGTLINDIQSDKNFDDMSSIEKRNVELIKRDYDKYAKIPVEFAQELTKHGAIATESWKKAKRKSDYSIFKKDLAKMIDLKKKQAHYFDSDKDPYDVMLDNNEFGFSKKVYDKIFEEAKAGLVPIIKAIADTPNQPDDSLILRHCPTDNYSKILSRRFHSGILCCFTRSRTRNL